MTFKNRLLIIFQIQLMKEPYRVTRCQPRKTAKSHQEEQVSLQIERQLYYQAKENWKQIPHLRSEKEEELPQKLMQQRTKKM